MTKLILRLTHRLWNRQISRILCRAYGANIINSRQMHILAAAFDPTQAHHVYGPNVVRGFDREDPAQHGGTVDLFAMIHSAVSAGEITPNDLQKLSDAYNHRVGNGRVPGPPNPPKGLHPTEVG